MNKQIITPSFYHVKTRDLLGGTLRTEVFKQDTGIFKAFSSYAKDKDERIVGYGESEDDDTAIQLSRKHLRDQWKTTLN